MTPVQQAAWFEAVSRFDAAQMQALMASGASIDTVDERGRTALFHVIAPWGGDPKAVAWLIEHGADVNVRDAQGKSAVQFGHAHVASGLESNMAQQSERLCREAGYVDDVGELKSRGRRRRR